MDFLSCADSSLFRSVFRPRLKSWSFSSSKATILLVSTKNRDLWPLTTAEVRDSWTHCQIWLAENYKNNFLRMLINWDWPEVLILVLTKGIVGSGDEDESWLVGFMHIPRSWCLPKVKRALETSWVKLENLSYEQSLFFLTVRREWSRIVTMHESWRRGDAKKASRVTRLASSFRTSIFIAPFSADYKKKGVT